MLYHTDPSVLSGTGRNFTAYFTGILMLICLFLRPVFIEIFYGYTSGHLKIKRYENDMVTVFLIQFMIFYTKDAMSPSQCPTAPG